MPRKMTLSNQSLMSSSIPKGGIWRPESFKDLMNEIENIGLMAQDNDSLILFRGQSNNEWPLDSTFVRNCIQTLFNIKDYTKLPSHIRYQPTFHRAIAGLLLMKFDKIIKPSQEAFEKEQSHGIDPYFELFKHVQQYPEKYDESPFIKGTNFIDWTYVSDIALYFSTFEGTGKNKKIGSNDGAFYVFNASGTGGIHQTIKFERLLQNMSSFEYLNGDGALPLMLHPQKQTKQHRAFNQKPIYITQMNFSYSLSDVWEQYEKGNNTKVFLKIVIDKDMKNEISDYLNEKGVSENHVYPH